MSIENYYNKDGVIYKRVLGATNEYGERSYTETSAAFDCALQPVGNLSDGYEVIENGKSIKSSHTIYCAITDDIVEGDKIIIDSRTFHVMLVSDDAGRLHHQKIRVREVL